MGMVKEPLQKISPAVNSSSNKTSRFSSLPDEHLILAALEEVLGVDETRNLVPMPVPADQEAGVPASSFENPMNTLSAARIQSALEDRYGVLAGRGLGVRVGRACVRYALHRFGSRMGLTGADFRLLPLKDRLKKGARSVREMLVLFGLPADLKENGGTIEYLLAGQSSSNGCALLLGFLQEAFTWIAAGRSLQVEEKSCASGGKSACTIRVALDLI